MRRLVKRSMLTVAIGLGFAFGGVVGVPWIIRASLNHAPRFYRVASAMPPQQRKDEAKRLVQQGLQLRNDIVNEPTWEAVFTDGEVNAWLAEDLVTSFADQIPPGITEPRLEFDDGKVTLAFQVDRGQLHSVLWVVARVALDGENVLALTLEKVRAGIVPVPATEYLNLFVRHARDRGYDVDLDQDGNLPVVRLHFHPGTDRETIVLEHLLVSPGQVRLSGRSDRRRGSRYAPSLPKGQDLQSSLSRRKTQFPDPRPSPTSTDLESAPSTARSETRPSR